MTNLYFHKNRYSRKFSSFTNFSTQQNLNKLQTIQLSRLSTNILYFQMNFVIVLAVLLAVFARDILANSCDANKNSKNCLAAKDDSGVKCSWCSSAAVGSTCFSETDAKSLPSSIYSCQYQKVMSGANSCDEYKSEKSCLSGTAGSSKCSWCKSAAVGATCFSEDDAKSLPSSIYACEYPKVSATASSCDEYKNEKSCMSGKVGNEKCSWCKSAAVGATCFVESDAKSLPSSVYACEYQKNYLRA